MNHVAAVNGKELAHDARLPPGGTSVVLDTVRITRWMWVATFAIIDFGVFRIAFINQIGAETSWGALRFFDLDKELSLPAWYSSILLWSTAIVLATNATLARRLDRRTAFYWWSLSVVFVYLSIDEMTSIHEFGNLLLPPDYKFTGFLTFSWVVVAAPLLIVGGLAFLPFLFRLPRSTALGIGLAGLVYVGGAFGMELVGGYFSKARDSIEYQLAVITEEGLELVGLSIFLMVLLNFLATESRSPLQRMAARQVARPDAL